MPSLLHGAVGTFRLPWRSTAEARPGAGGARRLRRGRAAAATIPGGQGAAAGPRAPLDAHRGEQLGVGAAAAGEVQRGVADVPCCGQTPWRVDGAAFCVGPSWEKCRKTTTTFSDHLRLCYLCRSAMMHEHVNFTQIISNHLKSSQITSCMDVPKHGHVKV